jgi:hypothetical protein
MSLLILYRYSPMENIVQNYTIVLIKLWASVWFQKQMQL